MALDIFLFISNISEWHILGFIENVKVTGHRSHLIMILNEFFDTIEVRDPLLNIGRLHFFIEDIENGRALCFAPISLNFKEKRIDDYNFGEDPWES